MKKKPDHRHTLAERRRARRLKVHIDVEYRGFAVAGRGVISELSLFGADVSESSAAVPKGVELELVFVLFPEGERVALLSEVVRQDRSGFTVRFLDGATAMMELLRSGLAIGGAPKSGS